MNIFLIVLMIIYFILNSIVIKKYEKKLKKLTEENENLKKELKKVGVM